LAPLLRLLQRLHLLAALIPLVFLGAVFVQGVSSGFAVKESAYTPIRIEAELAAESIRQGWESRRQPPASRVVAFWGLREQGGGAPDDDDFAVVLARQLLSFGATLRVAEDDAGGGLAALLGPGRISFHPDPLAACDGATEVVLANARPDLLALDLKAARDRMDGRFLVDCSGEVSMGIFKRTGFILLPLYFLKSPPWADPGFLDFVAEVAERVPEDQGILLMPDGPLETTNPRSRWFLHLNYFLAPRPLFLPLASEACGTAEQFQGWVEHLNLAGPGGRELTRRGLRATGAEWLIEYQHGEQFRPSEWTLRPAEEALQ